MSGARTRRAHSTYLGIFGAKRKADATDLLAAGENCAHGATASHRPIASRPEVVFRSLRNWRHPVGRSVLRVRISVSPLGATKLPQSSEVGSARIVNRLAAHRPSVRRLNGLPAPVMICHLAPDNGCDGPGEIVDDRCNKSCRENCHRRCPHHWQRDSVRPDPGREPRLHRPGVERGGRDPARGAGDPRRGRDRRCVLERATRQVRLRLHYRRHRSDA